MKCRSMPPGTLRVRLIAVGTSPPASVSDACLGPSMREKRDRREAISSLTSIRASTLHRGRGGRRGGDQQLDLHEGEESARATRDTHGPTYIGKN